MELHIINHFFYFFIYESILVQLYIYLSLTKYYIYFYNKIQLLIFHKHFTANVFLYIICFSYTKIFLSIFKKLKVINNFLDLKFSYFLILYHLIKNYLRKIL